MLPRKNFDKTFKTKIPLRDGWMVDSVMRDHVFSIFTVGSKTKTGPSCDIFSDDFGVFQLAKYMHSFLSGDICNRIDSRENCAVFTRSSTINIYVDSLSTIKALNSSMVKSKCLNECIKSPTLITSIRGNKKAYECAIHGSSLDEGMVSNNVLIPLVLAASEIDDWQPLGRTKELELCYHLIEYR